MRGHKISDDVKSRVCAMRGEGYSVAAIAREFSLGTSTVNRILSQSAEETPKDIAAPPRDCIQGFTPMYERIIELNREKKRINNELANIMATLRNALEIAESGENPK